MKTHHLGAGVAELSNLGNLTKQLELPKAF